MINHANRYLLLVLLLGTFASLQCSKKSGSNGSSYNSERSVGTSAGDLLSGSKYKSLKIEIQYMPGYEPDATAVNDLGAFLAARLNKPGGISIFQQQVPSSGSAVLSVADIAAYEKQHRTVYTNGDELGVYFLFTDGDYTDNNVLGVAYQNTSMCLFGKTIHDNSGAVGQASRTKLTATVLEHEFGHILGLVDLGSAMQTDHHDPTYVHHCDNTKCLMYYAAETLDALSFLISGPVPALDTNCLNDLKANGGK